MMPAGGAAVWSLVYSAAYSRASRGDPDTGRGEGQCSGYACFGAWAWGCAASVAVAIVLWCFAWRAWRLRNVVV